MKRHVRYKIALILTLSTVSGCKTTSTSNYCSIYLPVYTTADERAAMRDKTERAILKNNAVYMEMCK